MENDKIIEFKEYLKRAPRKPAEPNQEVLDLLPSESHRTLYQLCCLLYDGSVSRMIEDLEARRDKKPYMFKIKGNPNKLLKKSKEWIDIMNEYCRRKKRDNIIKLDDYRAKGLDNIVA